MLAQLAGAERRGATLPLASVRRMVVATLGRALDDHEFDELLSEVRVGLVFQTGVDDACVHSLSVLKTTTILHL